MECSAIILSGGFSKRFGREKGLVELMGKPMIRHVVDKVVPLVQETLIIVSNKEQSERYSKVFDDSTRIFVDEVDERSPLIGALTGFHNAANDYALLLSCDTPLVSRNFLSLLIDLSLGRDAVVPRWPNRQIEPLQAMYATKTTYSAAVEAFREGNLNLRAMISRLKNVLYVSTVVIKAIDPELYTFHNVNDPDSLKEAERILRP